MWLFCNFFLYGMHLHSRIQLLEIWREREKIPQIMDTWNILHFFYVYLCKLILWRSCCNSLDIQIKHGIHKFYRNLEYFNEIRKIRKRRVYDIISILLWNPWVQSRLRILPTSSRRCRAMALKLLWLHSTAKADYQNRTSYCSEWPVHGIEHGKYAHELHGTISCITHWHRQLVVWGQYCKVLLSKTIATV